MATTRLYFTDQHLDAGDFDTLVIAGSKRALGGAAAKAALPDAAGDVWAAMTASLSPGDFGASTATWLPGDPPKKLIALALSARASRHNSPGRPDILAAHMGGYARKGTTGIIVVLDDAAHAYAAGCAIARSFPTYSRKRRNTKNADVRDVHISLIGPDGAPCAVREAEAAASGIRLAAELVDMPPSELHTDAFVARAKAVADDLGDAVTCTVLDFAALTERGFGGLVGVGQAAVHKPALVHLSYRPAKAKGHLAWVGKGIVYDTGGLSLKTKTGMPGMKTDMGGAAAVLGAFQAIVQLGWSTRVDAILCLAENSVGPDATRPDDILQLYSSKTVEVNNTDAEGRLVLGDGVAFASKHLKPQVICDLATLTGAQMIATGKRHAAIICNDEQTEAACVAAGRASGDLVHPLPYAPEFFRSEFKSKVADLKNSVKDRMNAQSSCAGQFVAEHLVDFKGTWLHIDIAGPSTSKERGTGYGVALLVALFDPARQ